MRIHSEEHNRIFEEGEYPAFCCDSKFKVTAINHRFQESGLQFSVGDSLYAIMQNIKDASLFSQAMVKLSAGLPFFSTDFDIFRRKPIFIMPISIAEPEGNGFLFIFFFEQTGLLPSIGKAMPELVDRYRTPIFDIMNVTQALTRRFEDSEDYTGLDYLSHIMRCCYGMLRTTSSVQTYFKLVNGRQKFNKEKMMLKSHISHISKTLSLLFTTSKYVLRFNLCEEDFPIMADAELLDIALFHIIANACLFSPQGSDIVISLTNDDSSFTIVVSDEGDGIAATNMERVFEPFFTNHSSPVPEEQLGIGLGLPIAKKIIEEHGGAIYVKSAVHKGTDIIIRLPIEKEDTSPLTLHSNAAGYISNRLSAANIIFSDICNIKLR